MSRTVETLADTLVEVISPALIIAIVGSLACFCVEVLYQGEFNGRLQFILCLFAMGTVGIARISMAEGSAYASFFAAPLALVTALALFRFVEFGGALGGIGPLISLLLMAFIWWCTHQLTVDSTLLERQQDSTGSGLLTQLGWEGNAASAQASVEPQPQLVDAVSDHKATQPSTQSWWQAWLNPEGRPHSHGKWALYFALAAVPIFGGGQFFLGRDDLAERRWVFQLLVVYVASSLALLLATSFLGLRRYLKKRQLELPLEMAAGWLMIGGALIGGLLLAAFVLPRPSPEYSLAHLLPEIRAPQRHSTPMAVGNEGVQDRPQAPVGDGQKKKSQEDRGEGAGGEKNGENKADSSQGNAGQKSSNESSANGNSSSGQSSEKNGSSGEKKENSQAEDKQQDSSSSKSDGDQSGKSPTEKSEGKQQPAENQKAKSDNPSESKSNESQQTAQQPTKPQQSEANQTSSPPPPPPTSNPPSWQWLNSLPDVLNWLGMLVLLIVAGIVGWRYREQIAAAMRQLRQSWLDFLARLFGRKTEPTAELAANAAAIIPPPPFSSFADPFATGDAQRWPLLKLLTHSFSALEAFGRERSCERNEDQTPAEFAQALAARQPAVAAEVQQLAQLYGQVAYGPGVSGKAALQVLQRFWQRVRAAESS